MPSGSLPRRLTSQRAGLGMRRARPRVESGKRDPGIHRGPGSPKGALQTMSTIGNVTDTDFEANVLGSETPVLVDFWAEWCVPCHMVSPVVEEIAQEKGERLKLAKLNIDDNPEMTRKFGVMSIPSLILFKEGQEVARVVGAKPKDAILRDLNPHLS